MSDRKGCPRCEKRGLKTWAELSDDEREAVRRLPLSAEYPEEERKASHRWCTRCWYEEVSPGPTHA
ncbi:MAG TPA: hypothetical protein VLE19_12795 [Pyrinomonadaceae bacterium]|nr:hypothetical protein [Pyrinomonadaceae bacterium]